MHDIARSSLSDQLNPAWTASQLAPMQNGESRSYPGGIRKFHGRADTPSMPSCGGDVGNDHGGDGRHRRTAPQSYYTPFRTSSALGHDDDGLSVILAVPDSL
jgi:hypothetical protein